jgi:hypothetical protein
MAKVKLDPLFAGISGKIGNVVFKKSANGDVIVSKCPDMSRVKWSEAQKAHRQRFKLANEYAKAALADPDVRALYEELAAKEGKGAFATARSDYFKGKDLLSKK